MSPKLPSAAFMLSSYNDNDNGNDDDNDNYNDNDIPALLARKTKVIQSYLSIWGTYDPIELGPSDPKKWGLYRRSVKKCRFSGQNRALAAAPRPAVQRGQHKNDVFLLSGHDGNKKVGRFWQKNGFWAKKLHFRPEILHFFYATPMKPPFLRVREHASSDSEDET